MGHTTRFHAAAMPVCLLFALPALVFFHPGRCGTARCPRRQCCRVPDWAPASPQSISETQNHENI